jgi:hypothetical protein
VSKRKHPLHLMFRVREGMCRPGTPPSRNLS